MAVLSVQTSDLDGLVVSYEAADAAGDEFVNDGRTEFRVRNNDASAKQVTITSQRQCNQGYTHDEGGSVAAGDEAVFGPFDVARFNDNNGRVQVSYDDVTSVEVAVVKVG